MKTQKRLGSFWVALPWAVIITAAIYNGIWLALRLEPVLRHFNYNPRLIMAHLLR